MAQIGKNINRALMELNQGHLVGIPTETVYGLAGNALDPAVVAHIFEVKKRPFFDPLIVHIADASQLSLVVSGIPELAGQLINSFWPGPLTLVMPKKESVPDLVTGGLPTVAVRIPDHAMTLDLLKQLSFPLACPSANPFGYVSPTTADHVQQQLGDDIPYILDGGPCQVGVESTIIAFESQRPVIYRLGGISVEQITDEIGEISVKPQTPTPLAPGMLGSHYAPRKKVMLGQIPILLEQYARESVGILSLKDHFPGVNSERQIILSASGDLNEAAQKLFAALRKLDDMPISYILAEPVPDQGLGKAINDRLRRAAS